MSFTFRPAVRENFFRHVEKTDGCWLWTGCTFSNGYGRVRIERNRTVVAHRLSWEFANGPIPDGMCACHRCDVRACVNPLHLFLGTDADNVHDCMDKGRRADLSGSKHPMAKLSEADIAIIRERRKAGEQLKQIAPDFGVTRQMICNITIGKNWRNV